MVDVRALESSALIAYVRRRCGGGSPRAMFGRSVSRAFTAPTLGAFWHFWNPVYGYVLGRYCYRPMRRRGVPRAVALVATFAFSGFALHDLLLWPARLSVGARPLFPVVTVAFVVVAMLVLMTDAMRVDLRGLGPAARGCVHALCLVLAFTLSIGASQLLA